jgi:hypothetical protein
MMSFLFPKKENCAGGKKNLTLNLARKMSCPTLEWRVWHSVCVPLPPYHRSAYFDQDLRGGSRSVKQILSQHKTLLQILNLHKSLCRKNPRVSLWCLLLERSHRNCIYAGKNLQKFLSSRKPHPCSHLIESSISCHHEITSRFSRSWQFANEATAQVCIQNSKNACWNQNENCLKCIQYTKESNNINF